MAQSPHGDTSPTSTTGSAPEHLSAAAYGALPDIEGVRISPDGLSVLMLRPVDGARALFVADFGTNRGRIALRVNAANEYLNGCEWVSPQRVVCTILRFPDLRRRKTLDRRAYSVPMKTTVRLVAVDHDGTDRLELVPKPKKRPRHAPLGVRFPYNEKTHRVLDYLFEPGHILVSVRREHALFDSLYKLNVHTNSMVRVQPFVAGITEWSLSRDDDVRLGFGTFTLPFFGETDRTHAFASPKAVLVQGSPTRAIPIPHLGAPSFTPRVFGYTRDRRGVYVEAIVDGDRIAVLQVDAATLEIRDHIATDPERDVVATPVEGRECGLVGFSHIGSGPRAQVYVDGTDVRIHCRGRRETRSGARIRA